MFVSKRLFKLYNFKTLCSYSFATLLRLLYCWHSIVLLLLLNLSNLVHFRVVQNWSHILWLLGVLTCGSDSLCPVTRYKRVTSRVKSLRRHTPIQRFELYGLIISNSRMILQIAITQFNVLVHGQMLYVILLLLLRVLWFICVVFNVEAWCFKGWFSVRLGLDLNLIWIFASPSSSFKTGFLAQKFSIVFEAT